MQAKLTPTIVKSASVKDKPYEILDAEIKGFLLRVQPSGVKSFYFSYRNKSRKRARIKIGTHNKTMTTQQARDEALIYAAEVRKGVDVQRQKTEHRQQAIEAQQKTLKAFIQNHYKPWVLANQKSGQDSLNSLNSSFSEFMDLPLSDLTISRLEKWRITRTNAGIKPTTINRQVATLRGVLSRAMEWDVIDDHPLKKLKALKTDNSPKIRYLTPDEEKRLFKALEQRDEKFKQARKRSNQHRQKRGYELLPSLLEYSYADRLTPLIILSLKTGLRRGEAFDLTWQYVNLERGLITLIGDTTKSMNTRYIPLSPTALEALKAWKKQAPQSTGRVFPSDDGGRLDNLNKSWKTLLGNANISCFRWHDMRHDFASQLVMKGVPLNTVRELCGHANMQTTQKYAHLAPDHKADAVALLG